MTTRTGLRALGTVALVAGLSLALPAASKVSTATVNAERVGMDTGRLERITAHMQRAYLETGKFSGAINLVARDGQIVYFEPLGVRGMEDPQPMTTDALFRIYSMTKPITAVAAMMLYEEGYFQLSDPITKWLPELKDLKVQTDDGLVNLDRPITMRHLLTHTAGFSYGFFPQADPIDKQYVEAELWQSDNLDAFVEKIAQLPLKFQPGTQWHYSIAVDLTGLIVERISGVRFDEFLKTRIFDPLGMVDTFFDVPEEKQARLLPNHVWNAKEDKQMPFERDVLARYQDVTLFSGGGGLVSSTLDYFRFCEMLRRGGELDGVRLLSPQTVRFMTMDHLPATAKTAGQGENPSTSFDGTYRGAGFGLGFGVVTDVSGTRTMGSLGDYSWGGAAGTIFWIDPVEELIVIGMIQQMQSPHPYRSELKTLTHQAIVEPKQD
ncbi:MAG: serine hydrolase domain-containing protein [Pseudomonadota bacterium]